MSLIDRLGQPRILITGAALAALLLAAAAFVYLEPWLNPGSSRGRTAEAFRDCDICPDMLPIEPGTVAMGERPGRRERWLGWLGGPTTPRRSATIARPFAVGRTEVTFDQWDACLADGGCGGHLAPDEGWGRGDRPVIHVSWDDAQSYVQWLSMTTGRSYRLLSEAEWEYVARSGFDTPYPWGKLASHDRANYGMPDCDPCEGAVAGRDAWLTTAPVGSFPPNANGVHDMHGNVYEWTQDCHRPELPPEPVSADAYEEESCERRVIRGGAWYSNPWRITSSYRAYQTPDHRARVIGFRVARDPP
jgi:formylglycine-generating enzyme required for sulfatase activity